MFLSPLCKTFLFHVLFLIFVGFGPIFIESELLSCFLLFFQIIVTSAFHAIVHFLDSHYWVNDRFTLTSFSVPGIGPIEFVLHSIILTCWSYISCS